MAMPPVIIGLRNDTGTPGDGITADSAPMLFGTATPEATVRLLLGGVQIGSATAGPDGIWQALANVIGEASVTLIARDAGGDSAPFRLAVDQTAPAAPLLTGFAGDTSGDRSQPIWQTVDTTPSVAGTAEPGAIIRAWDGNRLLATALAGAGGAWSLDLGSLPLGQYYAIGIEAEDGAGNTSTRTVVNLRLGETTVPVVTAIQAPAPGNYQPGQAIDITVQFNKPVVIHTGAGIPIPGLEVLVGDQILTAGYLASPAPHRLTFRLILPAGVSDGDGIGLGGLLGSITDTSNNPVSGGLAGVPDLSGVLVAADLTPPAIAAILGPAPGNHRAGDLLAFTLVFTEAVQLAGSGAPVLEVLIGGTTWQAALTGQPAPNRLAFGLVVEAEAVAQTGIALGRLLLDGATVTDRAGNAWSGALGTLPDFSSVFVQADFDPPAITSIALESGGPAGLGAMVVIALHLSEAVIAGPTTQLDLSVGGQAVTAAMLPGGTDPTLLRFGFIVSPGLLGQGFTLLGLEGAVQDAAGHVLLPGLPAAPSLAGLLLDGVVPEATLIAPATARFIPGQTLRLTLAVSEAVHLAPGDALPALLVGVGAAIRPAVFDAALSTSTKLVFSLAVQPGDLARSGITLLGLDDPAGRLQDAAGNPLHATLPSGPLAASLWPEDQQPPVLLRPEPPGHGAPFDLTLLFSEPLILSGGAPELDLLVDGVAMVAGLAGTPSPDRLAFHLDLAAAPQDVQILGLRLGSASLTDAAGNPWEGSGLGAVTLRYGGGGGPGDDLFIQDTPGPGPEVPPGDGHDTLLASVDATLPANVEALRLVGAARNGSGNAGDNSITGTAGANLLRGLGGDDSLDGGGGADLLIGGPGDDRYLIHGGGERVMERPGGGWDTVLANIPGGGATLPENVEALVLLGTTLFGRGNAGNNSLTGSASGNWLLGGAGADTLDGGGGSDTLFGGAGADLFLVGHGATLIGDFTPGADHLRLSGFANFAAVLAATTERAGSAVIDLGGGDSLTLLHVPKAALAAGDVLIG
ncbi:hypothetical protein JMJ55_01190 [Belnapia sp. T6]|uniref:Uncharacterized protein n=1 Tax=Belnapia mucosa TaxID=2804532 RepID=A0ABS1UWR6_9PROT|nr:Ig-like domain-containing protein [Belnapia mucosa]MBL6453916.1 hypothetical protein [Belnapia mucosa]